MMRGPSDQWSSGVSYDAYMGRWSRLIAARFLAWLAAPPESGWLDVGCGTGALSGAILQRHAPRVVHALDRSTRYVAHARAALRDPRLRVAVASATDIPLQSAGVDCAVSGLVLNFVGEPDRAVREMARAARPGGTVAAYVWDYAGEMQFLRRFWDAAAAEDPAARHLDEGRRFPLCSPPALGDVFRRSGLTHVEIRAIDVPTRFRDFADFWSPFLSGQGPAPGYVMSLPKGGRAALERRLRDGLSGGRGGSIDLVARAWAARGAVPA